MKHRSILLPPGGSISTREHDVVAIQSDTVAKDFVVATHYSKSYPAARERFGLYHHDQLVGVAVFSVPVRPEVVTNWLPCPLEASIELGRFVLLPEVAYNGETWFYGRCRELLRRMGYEGIVSFSDPVPRRVGGVVIFPGHVGFIYQASNAIYAGRGRPRYLRMLPDGRTLSDRALAKLKAGHRGRRYVASLLEGHGAVPLQDDEDAAAWASTWVPKITTRVYHAGNHRYLWGLHPKLHTQVRKAVDRTPYPKQVDA
jgi:hypothetical protein